MLWPFSQAKAPNKAPFFERKMAPPGMVRPPDCCWIIKKSQVHSKFILNGSFITAKSTISSKFNDFFVNMGPNLAKKIPPQNISPLKFMGNPITNSIFLPDVTTDEMKNIVLSLKNGAAGWDDITPHMLKMIGNSINHPLVYMINLSLQQGIFPKQLKIANVLPLFKANDPSVFNNYRPVSLLCVLSKVYEKVMYNRLIRFLEISISSLKINLDLENYIRLTWHLWFSQINL